MYIDLDCVLVGFPTFEGPLWKLTLSHGPAPSRYVLQPKRPDLRDFECSSQIHTNGLAILTHGKSRLERVGARADFAWIWALSAAKACQTSATQCV